MMTDNIHESFVASRVLFAARQLSGFFKWNDAIRISPCPDTALIGSGLDPFEHGFPAELGGNSGPPFPFQLEARIPKNPDGLAETNRTLRELDTYQYLFTLLLAPHVGLAHWLPDRLWAPLKRDRLIVNYVVRPGFFTNENGRQDDFPEREYGPAPVFDGDDYYEYLWSSDPHLRIPSSLGDDLSLFKSLPPDESNDFRRACYWFALGIQFRSERSLATVAFSTAIECLLPNLSSPACDTCGKPTGPGPTRLFKDHVDRYGYTVPELIKRRKKLYDARSDLVHGAFASRVDRDFMANRFNDNLSLLELVSRRSLIGWLRDSERRTWHAAVGKGSGQGNQAGEGLCARIRAAMRGWRPFGWIS
jgi:hypothetical protein